MVNIDPSGLCYTGLMGSLGRAVGSAISEWAAPWVEAGRGRARAAPQFGHTLLARAAPVWTAPRPENYETRGEWFRAYDAHLGLLTLEQRRDPDVGAVYFRGSQYW